MSVTALAKQLLYLHPQPPSLYTQETQKQVNLFLQKKQSNNEITVLFTAFMSCVYFLQQIKMSSINKSIDIYQSVTIKS